MNKTDLQDLFIEYDLFIDQKQKEFNNFCDRINLNILSEIENLSDDDENGRMELLNKQKELLEKEFDLFNTDIYKKGVETFKNIEQKQKESDDESLKDLEKEMNDI